MFKLLAAAALTAAVCRGEAYRTPEMAYHKQESRILSEIPGPYRRLWLKQNRPGGLEDSVQRLFLHGQNEPEKKEMQ